MLKITDPTGQGIREWDAWGSGRFKAARGEKRHDGLDFVVAPVGQEALASIEGKILRRAWPYEYDDRYCGVLIEGRVLRVMIFYVDPYPDIIGKSVKAGQPIGICQDITLRKPYPGMIPHLHLKAWLDPLYTMTDDHEHEVLVDPEVLL